MNCYNVFFFQAEDGIRDDLVTGVQTCALPISPVQTMRHTSATMNDRPRVTSTCASSARSEERRVGKECRSRRSAYDEKKEFVYVTERLIYELEQRYQSILRLDINKHITPTQIR